MPSLINGAVPAESSDLTSAPLRTNFATAASEIGDLQLRLDTAQATLSNAQTDVVVLQQGLSAAQTALTSAQNDITTLQQQVAALTPGTGNGSGGGPVAATSVVVNPPVRNQGTAQAALQALDSAIGTGGPGGPPPNAVDVPVAPPVRGATNTQAALQALDTAIGTGGGGGTGGPIDIVPSPDQGAGVTVGNSASGLSNVEIWDDSISFSQGISIRSAGHPTTTGWHLSAGFLGGGSDSLVMLMFNGTEVLRLNGWTGLLEVRGPVNGNVSEFTAPGPNYNVAFNPTPVTTGAPIGSPENFIIRYAAGLTWVTEPHWIGYEVLDFNESGGTARVDLTGPVTNFPVPPGGVIFIRHIGTPGTINPGTNTWWRVTTGGP